MPLHPGTHELIHDYLEAVGHGADDNGALFRPFKNNRTGRLDKALTPDGFYRLVRGYSPSRLRGPRHRLLQTRLVQRYRAGAAVEVGRNERLLTGQQRP